MKKFYVVAALLMASTAAHAGNSVSFEIQGHKIHIEAPRNCDSLSCIQISSPGLSGSGFNLKGLKGFNNDDDNDVADNSNPPPAQNPVPAPVAQAPAPQPAAPVANNAPPAPATVATNAPAASAPVVTNVAPAAPAVVATATAAPAPASVAAAPAPAPTTPIGLWATEENKGNVRIEPCGPNLCGYAENTGEKILISMKPSGAKWTGQIHDPDSGSDYDSTIAMKGANALKVQGCAFGGVFCGGQTWKRIS
ncbi:DUF2147 domain-containing protein [Bradyrhizobium canariense]|uniref:Uncharacterized conserved protein, DUF2147 family n=1 Tax=Bradyrhizobium canariense TaxID=255045 RepID=A0A1H1VYD5_9BRAD|nr:DUF2147 domain-containing protein [Bradyrhizobium canariense]SDS89461.1 Uncharacterized conserved protein, DUF2147 family [Bradyrhizobium canariense]